MDANETEEDGIMIKKNEFKQLQKECLVNNLAFWAHKQYKVI